MRKRTPYKPNQYAVSLMMLVERVWLLEMLIEWRVRGWGCLLGVRWQGMQK